MKFLKPEINTKRTRKWFAWLPVTIGRDTRWLETVHVKQIYIDYQNGWCNVEFLAQ